MVARYGRSGGVNDEVSAVDKLSGEKAQEDMVTFFWTVTINIPLWFQNFWSELTYYAQFQCHIFF